MGLAREGLDLTRRILRWVPNPINLHGLENTWFGDLCYAIVLPGRKSAFRAGFWPDCFRESTEIGPGRPKAGRRADFGAFPGSRLAKIRPGRPIYSPEALLRNIE